MLVHVLSTRDESFTSEQRIELAGILSRCGESKQAGLLLLEAAREQQEQEEKTGPSAREARRLGGRQPEILRFLRDALDFDQDPDPAELAEVLSDLADLCIEDLGIRGGTRAPWRRSRNFSRATRRFPPRKARVLHKLGRPEEATEILLGLAEVLRQEGRKEKLAAVYEQILKIDYRRKDVARALKRLHATRFERHQRATVAALALCLLGGGGWFWYSGVRARTTSRGAR